MRENRPNAGRVQSMRPNFTERERDRIHAFLSGERERLWLTNCKNALDDSSCQRCGMKRYCRFLILLSRTVNGNAENSTNFVCRTLASALRRAADEINEDD